jgi:hypothetical protein
MSTEFRAAFRNYVLGKTTGPILQVTFKLDAKSNKKAETNNLPAAGQIVESKI